jgi:hypothetical protein
LKTNRVFWIGLLIYGVSFFLVALGETQPTPSLHPLLGIFCAVETFLYPLLVARFTLVDHSANLHPPVTFLFLIVSGWINPIFFIAVILDLTELRPQLLRVLRVLLLIMVACSWVTAFYYFRAFPREGHLLWVTGMLLVLFPNQFTPRNDNRLVR